MPILTKDQYAEIYKHEEYNPKGFAAFMCIVTAIIIICVVLALLISFSGCTVSEEYPKKYTENGITYHRFFKTHYYWTIDNDSTQTTGTDWNYSPR